MFVLGELCKQDVSASESIWSNDFVFMWSAWMVHNNMNCVIMVIDVLHGHHGLTSMYLTCLTQGRLHASYLKNMNVVHGILCMHMTFSMG